MPEMGGGCGFFLGVVERFERHLPSVMPWQVDPSIKEGWCCCGSGRPFDHRRPHFGFLDTRRNGVSPLMSPVGVRVQQLVAAAGAPKRCDDPRTMHCPTRREIVAVRGGVGMVGERVGEDPRERDWLRLVGERGRGKGNLSVEGVEVEVKSHGARRRDSMLSDTLKRKKKWKDWKRAWGQGGRGEGDRGNIGAVPTPG